MPQHAQHLIVNRTIVGALADRPDPSREVQMYVDKDTGAASIANGEEWESIGAPSLCTVARFTGTPITLADLTTQTVPLDTAVYDPSHSFDAANGAITTGPLGFYRVFLSATYTGGGGLTVLLSAVIDRGGGTTVPFGSPVSGAACANALDMAGDTTAELLTSDDVGRPILVQITNNSNADLTLTGVEVAIVRMG